MRDETTIEAEVERSERQLLVGDVTRRQKVWGGGGEKLNVERRANGILVIRKDRYRREDRQRRKRS